MICGRLRMWRVGCAGTVMIVTAAVIGKMGGWTMRRFHRLRAERQKKEE